MCIDFLQSTVVQKTTPCGVRSFSEVLFVCSEKFLMQFFPLPCCTATEEAAHRPGELPQRLITKPWKWPNDALCREFIEGAGRRVILWLAGRCRQLQGAKLPPGVYDDAKISPPNTQILHARLCKPLARASLSFTVPKIAILNSPRNSNDSSLFDGPTIFIHVQKFGHTYCVSCSRSQGGRLP